MRHEVALGQADKGAKSALLHYYCVRVPAVDGTEQVLAAAGPGEIAKKQQAAGAPHRQQGECCQMHAMCYPLDACKRGVRPLSSWGGIRPKTKRTRWLGQKENPPRPGIEPGFGR